MAFCKYCGKELEEGAVCSCSGALHEAQEKDLFSENTENTYDDTVTVSEPEVSADTKADAEKSASSTSEPATRTRPVVSAGPAIRRVNTGVNDHKSEDAESFKKFGAFVAAVLVVFIFILGCMAAGSGYKSTVKKYFRSRYSKHGGKTYYSLTLPNEGISELKDNDLWQELVEDYNDDIEDRMDDWDRKPKFRKISRVKDMKNSELKDAEKYFYSAAEVCEADIDEEDIQIKKGYAVTYKYKNTEGDNEKTTVYLVKLKGEGWKVMSGLGTSFFGLDK